MGGWASGPMNIAGYSPGIGEYSKAYHEFMMRQQMAAAMQAQRNADNAYKHRPMHNDDVIDLDPDQWSEVETPKQIEHK